MEKEIVNAKITSTMFGKEDHGILTCNLCIEGSGWGCWYGGYALDTPNKEKKRREATAVGLQAIMELLETLEVDKWENLKGQFVRVETSGWAGKITKIGHLIKDKWFSFEEVFNREKQGN